MARRNTYSDTYGSLALQDSAPLRDYREAERRLVAREAQPYVRPKSKPKIRIILMAVLILSAVFGLLMRQIQIEREVVKLHDMRTELQTEQRRGDDLRLELSLQQDIDNVQRVAKDSMNMVYPDEEMMRSVYLPPIKTGSTAEMTNVEEDGFALETPLWLEELIDSFNR